MDFRTRITFSRSGLPKRYWARDLNPVPEVSQWLTDYEHGELDMASDVFGQGLVLCGQQASSNAAWLVIQFLKHDNRDAVFVDWGSLMDDLSDREERSGIMSEAKGPRLLVLDQVPMVGRTDWPTQVMTRIVKSRYDDGNPTIITTSKGLEIARSSLANCFDFGQNVVLFVETLGAEG